MNNIHALKINPHIKYLSKSDPLKTLKPQFIKFFPPWNYPSKLSGHGSGGNLFIQAFNRTARHNVRIALLGTALFAAAIPGARAAESVRLSWNPNADTNVVAYIVYYGTCSKVYSGSINAGNATSAQVYCVNDGATYYFAVASVDAQGNQSALSGEVSYAVPLPIPSPLQAQVNYDQNGQPYSMTLTATSNDPGAWEMDCSTNLQSWSPYCSGNGSYVFATVFLTDTTKPQMYFRLKFD
jgi:hypothetical protein